MKRVWNIARPTHQFAASRRRGRVSRRARWAGRTARPAVRQPQMPAVVRSEHSCELGVAAVDLRGIPPVGLGVAVGRWAAVFGLRSGSAGSAWVLAATGRRPSTVDLPRVARARCGPCCIQSWTSNWIQAAVSRLTAVAGMNWRRARSSVLTVRGFGSSTSLRYVYSQRDVAPEGAAGASHLQLPRIGCGAIDRSSRRTRGERRFGAPVGLFPAGVEEVLATQRHPQTGHRRNGQHLRQAVPAPPAVDELGALDEAARQRSVTHERPCVGRSTGCAHSSRSTRPRTR